MNAVDTIELTRESSSGPLRAVVNPMGAGLEALSVGSLQLIQVAAPESPRPFYSGVTLAPWPNRLARGEWTWEGEPLVLPVNDVEHRSALHGLVSNRVFSIDTATDESVSLSCAISDEPGYPFVIQISVRYRLTETGLESILSATNVGNRPAPVALGTHPFVCIGAHTARSLTLTTPVESELLVDDHKVPYGITELHPDSPLGKTYRLADCEFDTTFRMHGAGPWRTIVESPEGTQVVVWQDSSFRWLQLFVTDVFPGPDGPVSALAIEPMTAPPQAFATGEDITVLSTGQDWSVTWGIDLVS